MYLKWKSWCMVPEIWCTTDFFCHFGPFLPCYCISNLKNWTFEKMKKKLGDIIILHLCTTNYDHTMYSSWNTEHDRQNFLMLWPFFALLPQENQNFETIKEVSQNTIISNMCTKNYDQMMSGNWDMVHDEQTDRQMDQQMYGKSDIKRWVPHLKRTL